MDLIFCPLYSGSSGNALFVQYGGTRLLVDAGKPGRTVEDALRFIGVEPESLNGILLTHEHSDHISGVGVLSRRWKLPVYATPGTWRGIGSKIGKLPDGMKRTFDRDADFYVGDLGVTPFAIPHDAAEPCGFRLWGGGVSLSTATDIGHYTESVHSAISGSDLILLERNHDPDMLRCNPHYSAALKRRILSNHGHLSNEACAEAIVRLAEAGTRSLILGHLSGENNTPSLALTTSENRVELEGMRLGEDIRIDLAWRDRVGGVYTLAQPDAVALA